MNKHVRRSSAFLMILLLWLPSWSRLAHAQEPAELLAVELRQNQRAPFAGSLINPALASEYSYLENDLGKCERNRGDDANEFDILLATEKSIHSDHLDDDKASEAVFRKTIEDVTPAWYERPSFTVPAAVVGTLLAILAVR